MKSFVKIVDPWLLERFPDAQVYTSLEGENPGGSIKDHMTKNGLEEMLAKGELEQTKAVSEITAGSAGVSLAHYAKELDIDCHIFLPDTASANLQNDLKKLGAKLYLSNISTAYDDYAKFVKESDVTAFDQMFDLEKAKYYQPIGHEFVNKIRPHKCAVLGGVGTGHSLEGISAGANAMKISCEPEPGVEVNGVRNIDEQQLGDNDPCVLRGFDDRLIVKKDEFYPEYLIFTDAGQIEICDSFRLVLGACVEFLTNNPKSTIFAIGAKNRRFLL
ncbi:MAG: pyridoxal-phosphate dependent enzyme [Bacteriovoracaceae bacterium]|nr:pyridoxal-phosphate dependent enzyme [Bacteriovoracaceae bacterium]